MPLLRLLLALAMLAWPATARAEAAYQLPVAKSGVQGAFWVSPPLKGHYSCPMDPDVTADAPGTCPKCNMDLECAPTHVRLSLGNAVAGRGVKLGVVGHPSFAKAVKFDAHGNAEANFPLPPGKYTFTADLTANKRAVHLGADYVLR
jgi:hypothetical protein